MHKNTVTVEVLQAGQPRAYADSTYESIISSRCDGMLLNGHFFWHHLPRERIVQMAKVLVHTFPDEPSWSDPKLVSCEQLGPTDEMMAEYNALKANETAMELWRPKLGCRWRVKIVQPYLD